MDMTAEQRADSNMSRSALVSAFGPRLEFEKALAPYTSFNTGGPARYFLAAQSVEEIANTVKAAVDCGLSFVVIGGGSNLLVSDAGFDGLVVKIDVRGLALAGEAAVRAGAGEDLTALVTFAQQQALTGLEFAAGIWGTVGGAVYGNAGAYGGEIGSTVSEVTVVDREGGIRLVDREYCRFGYRDSVFKRTGEIIAEVMLHLAAGDRREIQQRIDDILAKRRDRHPQSEHSAGCFFKNIADPSQEHGKLPAGRLLEDVGAKGLSVGGARVFEKHANIIINDGTATSKDIRQLADIMKKRVSERFGFDLREEVIQIGDF